MVEDPSLLSASKTKASSRSRVVTRPRTCLTWPPSFLRKRSILFCLLQRGQRTNRPLPQTPIMHPLHRVVRVVNPRRDVQTFSRTTPPQPVHQGKSNIAGSHSPGGVQRSPSREVLLPPDSKKSPSQSRRPLPGFLTRAFAVQYRLRRVQSSLARAPGTGDCA